MSPENFTYWLQGFFEISDSNKLSEKQVQIIKDHLALVFDKQTPDINSEDEFAPKTGLMERYLKNMPTNAVDLNNITNTFTSEESPLYCAKVEPKDSKAWDLTEGPKFGLGKCNIKRTVKCSGSNDNRKIC